MNNLVLICKLEEDFENIKKITDLDIKNIKFI